MGDSYKIKCVSKEGIPDRCDIKDREAKHLLWEFDVRTAELPISKTGDLKEINLSEIGEEHRGLAKDIFERCSVDTDGGKLLDQKCLGDLYYNCMVRRNSVHLSKCPLLYKEKEVDRKEVSPKTEPAVVVKKPKENKDQKRVKALLKKYKIPHAERLIRFARVIGYPNLELAVHKFINPKYPAPKDHTEFDDTQINNQTWRDLVGLLRPSKNIVPVEVGRSFISIKELEVSANIEGYSLDGKGTMVCVDVNDKYAFYLTAEHVISGKKNRFKHNRFIRGSDLSLVAIPLQEHSSIPKSLGIGKKLRSDEAFYSIGFGGSGKHPINLSYNANYGTINGVENRILYNSAAFPGDSGGAVLNKDGDLVGIMQAVGAKKTVQSRFMTLAFGDMDLIKETLEAFKEELAEP